MKLKRLNKRGFSLVEVVIAMAVVSIVTFTALSIIYPATDKTVEANAQSNAIYFAADAIECFKATKDSDEFFEALYYRLGIPYVQAPPSPDGINYLIPIDSQWFANIALEYGDYGDADQYTVIYDSITITVQSTDATIKPLQIKYRQVGG